MFERKYGNKAIETKNLSTTEIAALIRTDIKTLINAGTLPKGKYSVISKYYSGGSSIDIKVKSITGHKLLTDLYAATRRAGVSPDNRISRYTRIADEVVTILQTLHNSYNFDSSDSQYDHFDTRFLGNAEIDHKAEWNEAPWGIDKDVKS